VFLVNLQNCPVHVNFVELDLNVGDEVLRETADFAPDALLQNLVDAFEAFGLAFLQK
jgi:hypothetical protein